MLKIKEITSGYEGLQILNGISIEVKEKSIVTIVGGNGVGKSTLVKTICGLVKPTGGKVEFLGEDITGIAPHLILSKGLSVIPEGRQLFNNMSVRDNLYVGSITKDNKLRRDENAEKMYTLFPRLKEREMQLAGTLSGGEQQMLATARALMGNPRLLIMDEPTWGLAPLLVDEIFGIIETVRNDGTSVLLIEQNVHKSLSACDWGYVIEHGEIAMQGLGNDLLNDPNLKKAYLGI